MGLIPHIITAWWTEWTRFWWDFFWDQEPHDKFDEHV